MSDLARKRASRLREFHDAHQEYQETGSAKALERRNRAMRKGTSEDFRRAGEQLATESAQEGVDRKRKLREMKFKIERK